MHDKSSSPIVGAVSAQPLHANRGMDHPARTGLIGAGLVLGRTFQPNLLTRGSTDQAVISGASAAFAYGIFSTADALVDSLAARISGQDDPSAAPRLAVAAGLAFMSGVGAARRAHPRAVPPAGGAASA